jgi:hypothetical protein
MRHFEMHLIQVTMQKPDAVNVRTGIPLASVMGAAQAISGVNMGARYMSNMQTGRLKAAVNISTRVIDLETGEVLFMCSGRGRAQGESQLALETGVLGGLELNGGAGGFKQTVTGKAIQQAFASIGHNLNGYFAGHVDKKVVGSAGGGARYGDKLYVRGSSLYLGVEKLNRESAQTMFADNPNLFFHYRSTGSKIKRAKFWYTLAGVTGALGVTAIFSMDDGEGIVPALSALGVSCGSALIGSSLKRRGRAQLLCNLYFTRNGFVHYTSGKPYQ